MTGPVSGVTRKCFEIELAVRRAHELGSPALEIVHYTNDVVNPNARQLRIDQLATMLENILEMKFGAVILAHSSCETSACYGCRAAGCTTLRHLNDANTSFGTFECGHCARCSAAHD